MNTAQYYIESLKLSPHPEGGYYRETYRSPDTVLRETAVPPDSAPYSG